MVDGTTYFLSYKIDSGSMMHKHIAHVSDSIGTIHLQMQSSFLVSVSDQNNMQLHNRYCWLKFENERPELQKMQVHSVVCCW